jgi:Ras-related protein Rab-5C
LDKARSWIEELHKQASPNIIIALAGNKKDLESRRVIPTETAREFAQENNLLFLETSAKTAENVYELFSEIARRLPLEEQARATRPISTVDVNAPSRGGNCAC